MKAWWWRFVVAVGAITRFVLTNCMDDAGPSKTRDSQCTVDCSVYTYETVVGCMRRFVLRPPMPSYSYCL